MQKDQIRMVNKEIINQNGIKIENSRYLFEFEVNRWLFNIFWRKLKLIEVNYRELTSDNGVKRI